MSTTAITPANLQALLGSSTPWACIDIREYGEYNDGHIPGSSPLPRRLLEFRMGRFVPDVTTPLAVCDDDGRRAKLATATLEQMGYTDVRVLEGGLEAWRAGGLPVEWGTNVPSKDFGERVQIEQAVPEIEPLELAEWQANGKPMVLLDARTPEEHSATCIPSSRSMPTVELALRAGAVARPDETVVVHCAGRTRSIVGAQTLRRMGYRNVYALKNGTMGWVLDGLTPENGSTRVEMPDPAEVPAERARALAFEDGVQFIREVPSTGSGNVYLIDVRTREEYLAGHIPGFQWVPGGQAIQRADEIIGVRTGHIVFASDDPVRAAITGSWFRQMGFPNVYVLEGGAFSERGEPPEMALADVPSINQTQATEALKGNPRPLVLFVDTSREYAAGHLLGSFWLPRGWLELYIEEVARDEYDPIILASRNAANATLAAATLIEMGYRDVTVLEGGAASWPSLETGLQNLLVEPNDVVRAGTERTREEMLHYLEWEEALGEKYHNRSR